MTLSNTYVQALLSDLAYVDFSLELGNGEVNATRATSRLGLGSQAAASQLLSTWSPIATLNDPSGAQATVFHNAATNAYTVAVRGTEPAAEDYAQDLLLAVLASVFTWLARLNRRIPETARLTHQMPEVCTLIAKYLRKRPSRTTNA